VSAPASYIGKLASDIAGKAMK